MGCKKLKKKETKRSTKTTRTSVIYFIVYKKHTRVWHNTINEKEAILYKAVEPNYKRCLKPKVKLIKIKIKEKVAYESKKLEH